MEPLNLNETKLVVIVANEKGGVRKTSNAMLVGDYFGDCGFHVDYIQIDKQGRLEERFGDRVISIGMPSVAAIRKDDLADGRALLPVYDCLLNIALGVRIVDTGANMDTRFFDWTVNQGLAEQCAELGITVLGIIPILPDSDAIKLGLRTATRFSIAFPGSPLLVIIGDDGADLEQSARDEICEKFSRAVEIDHNEIMFIEGHRLLPNAVDSLERARLSALRFAATSIPVLATLLKVHPSLVGIVRGDVQIYVASMVTELRRFLHVAPA